MNLLSGLAVKAWRWSQTQLPLLLHTDTITNDEGYKAVKVKIIFLLNYCQYCSYGFFFFFLVKIALEQRGDSWVNLSEEQSEKLNPRKGSREEGCRGVWGEGGFDLTSDPHSHLNRPEVVPLRHGFVTLARDRSRSSLWNSWEVSRRRLTWMMTWSLHQQDPTITKSALWLPATLFTVPGHRELEIIRRTMRLFVFFSCMCAFLCFWDGK